MQSTTSLTPDSPSYSRGLASETSSVTPSTLKQTLSSDTMTSTGNLLPSGESSNAGFRAAEAYVRPAPIAVHGDILAFGFDLRNCIFNLTLTAPTSTRETAPTEIFLPEWHFPSAGTSVEVSGGKWTIDEVDEKQTLRWWHAEGDQRITVKGVKKKMGGALAEEDDGYLKQYQQQLCSLM
jgi:hypothetical protein